MLINLLSANGSVVVDEINPSFSLLYAHGAFMAAAFLAVFPAGSAVARYCKKWSKWDYVHRGVQTVGIVLMMCGFTLAVVHVHSNSNRKLTVT